MRYAINGLVMTVAALGLLSVVEFDVRLVVAAVLASLGLGAVVDMMWGD